MTAPSHHRRRRLRHGVTGLAALIGMYVMLAYIVLPLLWTHYEHQPALAGRTFITHTKQGFAGDPLNVGLVGSREQVVRALHAAGWYPADPVTLKTSIEIAGSVLFDRPYRSAPVSTLYYDGRPEDLAFEKPSGTSADRRQHVRFWLVLPAGAEGQPVWLGSATFDRSVGLSRYTGQITHHIAADIDAERDDLIRRLSMVGVVLATYKVTGIGPTLIGRNGEGDRYRTDGEIWIARLAAKGDTADTPPRNLAAPLAVQWKDAVWRKVVPTQPGDNAR